VNSISKNKRGSASIQRRLSKGFLMTGVASAVMAMSTSGFAQEGSVEGIEEVVVTGIRSSLKTSPVFKLLEQQGLVLVFKFVVLAQTE